MRSTVCWATYPDTRRRRGRGRSGASRSSRGSTVIARSSSGSPAVAANPAAKRRGMVRGTGGIHSRERDDDAAEGSHEHARDRVPPVLVLSEQVPDARTVARSDSRVVEPHVVPNDERRVVLDPGPAPDRANQVVDLLPDAHGSGEPSPRRSSKAPTCSTTARRRKIVYEIPRFQRLSSVRTAASAFHDADDAPEASSAPPGQSVEIRGRLPAAPRPAEAARADRPQSSSGNATMSELTWSRPTFRARESPARIAGEGARGRVRRDLGQAVVVVLVDDDHTQPPNPLRLDATRADARARRSVPPSRRRGRTTEAPAARAVGYGTCRPRRSSPCSWPSTTARPTCAQPSRASSGRPSPISSSWWSTTARPMPRRMSSPGFVTRACASFETRSGSV